MPAPFTGDFRIELFQPTDRGQEIDLLLRAGAHAVIIECKVLDSQKVYQLMSYRDFWRRTHREEPTLVWLVQKRQSLIGSAELGARTITWNELSEALVEAMPSTNAAESKLMRRFVSDLHEAAIALPEGTALEKRQNYRGYDSAAVHRLLSEIRDQVPQLIGPVDQTNELSPALHVGLRSWADVFADRWTERIYFYYKPGERPDSFYFQAQFLLFHRHKSGSPYGDSSGRRVGEELINRGFLAWRNRPGKWRHREALPDLLNVGPRLNYCFLEEPEELAQQNGIHTWRNEREAVREGARSLKKFVGLVDQALRAPSS